MSLPGAGGASHLQSRSPVTSAVVAARVCCQNSGGGGPYAVARNVAVLRFGYLPYLRHGLHSGPDGAPW
jgi:hypothetical protein